MTFAKINPRFLYVIPVALFIPVVIWGYSNEVDQSITSAIYYLIVFFVYVLSLLLIRYVDKILIKRSLLYRFGAMNKFNALVFFLILTGFLALFFVIYSFDSRKGYNGLFFSGILFLSLGILQIRKYYLKINEKFIDKFDFEPVLIKEVKDIEILDELVIVSTNDRNLKIYFNYLHKGEKELLIEVLKRIQQNKSIEII